MFPRPAGPDLESWGTWESKKGAMMSSIDFSVFQKAEEGGVCPEKGCLG